MGEGFGVGGLVLNKHVNDKHRIMSNLGIVAYKACRARQNLIFSAICRGRLGEAEYGLECIFCFFVRSQMKDFQILKKSKTNLEGG